MDYSLKEVAGRIKGLREAKGYTQEELAKLTGVSVEEYRILEQGNTDFSFTFIYKCAKACAVEVVDIREGEIQTAIIIPKDSHENTHGFYIKYAMRNALDIATNGCSVNVRLSEDKKTFERVRIAYGVAGPIPMRAPNAEAFITGKEVTMENIEAFSQKVLEDINPRDSWRASKALRQHVAVESAKRCIVESVKRAGGVL